MKKLVILLFMAFALTVSANETKPEGTKKQVKKEKVQLENKSAPGIGGNDWYVPTPREDEMDCVHGGDTDCPIEAFLAL